MDHHSFTSKKLFLGDIAQSLNRFGTLGLQIFFKGKMNRSPRRSSDRSSTEKGTEEWAWVGFTAVHRPDELGIYVDVNYGPEPATKDCFKKFVTLPTDDDIKELDKLIDSPSCDFINNKGEIFYGDCQGCIYWALEKKTGRVYIYDQNSPVRTYVAKTFAEFLTRMQWEVTTWKEKTDEMLRNLPRPNLSKQSSRNLPKHKICYNLPKPTLSKEWSG